MKYAAQYLRSAALIIGQYDGTIPLAAFLKQYFKANTKFGSKDRRFIGQLCYTYFRTGHAIVSGSVEEKIKASLFLCEQNAGEWNELFSEDWLMKWSDAVDKKWEFIESIFPGSNAKKLFLWKDELSKGIDAVQFSNSHLIQPDLFLRIRPGREKGVLQKLAEEKIAYKKVGEDGIALANATKIDAVLEIDKEVVVQDLSSQRVKEFIQAMDDDSRITKTIWDCCAASGGKSLLVTDTMKNISLTVSDVRPSILRNLKERFEKAGIRNYDSFIADLSGELKNHPAISGKKFRIILCDAPCSGSGTWGRTPEQLLFFTADKINTYSTLQKKIISNVIPYLEDGGYLLYITCSVFKKENEEIVAMIQKEGKLELIRSEVLKGYDRKADSMFAGLFKLKVKS